LIKDPTGQVRRIYDRLGLGEFDRVLPKLEEYAASKAGYKKDRYQLSGDVRDRITEQWQLFIQKYGYGPSSHNAS
jgi:hypothetical protein